MSVLRNPARLLLVTLVCSLAGLALAFAALVALSRHSATHSATPCLTALWSAPAADAPAELPPRLEAVARRLQEDMVARTFAAPDFEVWVSQEARPQARAHLDQGSIEVTQGLLDAVLSDDELYAVLAHEGAHLARHANKCAATADEQRGQELDADQQAAELLAAVGRDPAALARALRKLEDAPTVHGSSTHPSLQARLDALPH